jgi:hypothetical protein
MGYCARPWQVEGFGFISLEDREAERPVARDTKARIHFDGNRSLTMKLNLLQQQEPEDA